MSDLREWNEGEWNKKMQFYICNFKDIQKTKNFELLSLELREWVEVYKIKIRNDRILTNLTRLDLNLIKKWVEIE